MVKIKCPYCGNEGMEAFDIGHITRDNEIPGDVIKVKYACFDCDPDDGKEFTVIFAPARIIKQ